MVALWSVSKALQIPIDERITELHEIPYTISFVIRKRQQVDSFSELPKEKRPTEKMIWEGTSEELNNWLERVFDQKKQSHKAELVIGDVEE